MLAGLRPLLVSSRVQAGRAGRGADPSGTSSRRRFRDDVGMTRRPNESAAQWFERAIVTNSVAAEQQETLSEGSDANPAAREAIDQRAREAAADLELAAAAFRAERLLTVTLDAHEIVKVHVDDETSSGGSIKTTDQA